LNADYADAKHRRFSRILLLNLRSKISVISVPLNHYTVEY